jgi:hypothetical protein
MSAARLLSKLRESFDELFTPMTVLGARLEKKIDPPVCKTIPVNELIHDRIYAGEHMDGYGLMARWDGPANLFEHAEFMLGKGHDEMTGWAYGPHFHIVSLEHSDEPISNAIAQDSEFFTPKVLMHAGSPTYQKAGWRKLMDSNGGVRVELGTFDAPA